MNKTSDYGKWDRAKKRYMEWYARNYDYVHCLNEECYDPNMPPHTIHHIIARSKAPLNKHLHHIDNLIMLCQECHDKFHFAKSKDDYRQAKRWQSRWVKERGLNKLFKRG